MPDAVDLLGVLTTPSYVSIITGDPGVGKTTLALMACARHGSCSYISYADPPQILEDKLNAVSPAFKGKFKVINALSGNPEGVFSAIAEAVEMGEVVVVDTVDAMLYEADNGLRTLLQLIYGSVKTKKGSLILISEGISPASLQLRFVSDALVSIAFEEVLGQWVRAVRLLKDRSRPTRSPMRYVTFSNMSILEPYVTYKQPLPVELREITLSPLVEAEVKRGSGGAIMMELDESITGDIAMIYVELFVSKYLKDGLPVNWMIGPTEDEEKIKADIAALAGSAAKGLKIIKAEPSKADYRAKRFYELMAKAQGPSVVDFVNLMAEEDFAVTAPVEYEKFLNMVLKDATEKKRAVLTYGYSNLSSTAIEKKYVHEIRRLVSLNGFLFWRSIRPPGPLYFVDMKPEKGSIEFVEML